MATVRFLLPSLRATLLTTAITILFAGRAVAQTTFAPVALPYSGPYELEPEANASGNYLVTVGLSKIAPWLPSQAKFAFELAAGGRLLPLSIAVRQPHKMEGQKPNQICQAAHAPGSGWVAYQPDPQLLTYQYAPQTQKTLVTCHNQALGFPGPAEHLLFDSPDPDPSALPSFRAFDRGQTSGNLTYSFTLDIGSFPLAGYSQSTADGLTLELLNEDIVGIPNKTAQRTSNPWLSPAAVTPLRAIRISDTTGQTTDILAGRFTHSLYASAPRTFDAVCAQTLPGTYSASIEEIRESTGAKGTLIICNCASSGCSYSGSRVYWTSLQPTGGIAYPFTLP